MQNSYNFKCVTSVTVLGVKVIVGSAVVQQKALALVFLLSDHHVEAV